MFLENYPKNLPDNLEFRSEILSSVDTDDRMKSALYSICKEDPLFWFNIFCWTYEPRREQQEKLGCKSPHIPFVTWNYQDDLILWLVEKIKTGEDGLIEKSRDMGLSWVLLTVILHFWLFGASGNDFLLGSRKEEFVDRYGLMDALFPKLRYQLYKQPLWLRPVDFDKKRHDNFLRLQNPANGNFIKGESNNRYFGTGGRYKAVLLDEFSKWETTDELVWQSLSDATPCKLPISSANGRNNHFYRLRSGNAGQIDVKRIHWKKHPLKDMAWYNSEKRRRTPQDLAAEVDIDYTASISNKAYENFDFNIHCAKPYPEYYPDVPINLTCDFNVDPMCWCICQKIRGVDCFIDELVVHSTVTGNVIAEFIKRYKNHRYKEIYIYGDASGKFRDTRSKRSDYRIIVDMLQNAEWQVNREIRSKNPPIKSSVNAMNKRLRDWENDDRSWVKINPEKCPTLVDSLEQTRLKDNGIDKSDNVEHMSDAARYYFSYKYPVYRTIASSWPA